MVESLPSKQVVAGSSPVSRSTELLYRLFKLLRHDMDFDDWLEPRNYAGLREE